MGGGSSFHRNMLANMPDDFFDIKCIYLDPLHWVAARTTDLVLKKNDIIFAFDSEPEYKTAKNLHQHISNKKGAIVANLPQELQSLNYFWKPNKTVYFICHDAGFLYLCKKYDYLIDIFIAHNYQVYQDIIKLLPHREKEVYFIQHGVTVQNFEKPKNLVHNLNIVFLARHVKIKGIYDLPKIDDHLKKQGIDVNWTILGDGEERINFIENVKDRNNFSFKIPNTSEEIICILKNQDVYVLPSSHDGLPVSMLEAMSVGCVPIVYNFSEGIKKVVTSEIGAVLELEDYIGISEFIKKLHLDRNLLSSMSTNCIKKINREFDIKKQANEYFKLYKKYKTLKNRKLSLQKIENRYPNSRLINFILRVIKKINRVLS
ncbi:hypothetical protein GCM10010992_09990 [Cloacibacterium rupense]|uniref:Glycosyl transferase family 1 domain-containing protein n=2 Tax=Cloacibacterium rupense TaxID=517423 RepID=A0ABQ2NGX7_9FLAO|nr:hypothetical protein GCM10010992_09990 [Cloacibacterium rupense]